MDEEDFENERARRIAENRQRMAQLDLHKQADVLAALRTTRTDQDGEKKPRKKTARDGDQAVEDVKFRDNPRRSSRVANNPLLHYYELDEHDRPVVPTTRIRRSGGSDGEDNGLLNLTSSKYREGDIVYNSEAWKRLEEARCRGKGRGSVYDKSLGITCHFCRQKKLCAEDGCPRCSRRDADAQCIGKSACPCGQATGFFCRSCLLVRYGQQLEDLRAAMNAGTWRCPHCYEAEHPDEGWICNSSFCMQRRGLRCTGIAIYKAYEEGYDSVASMLKARLQKLGVRDTLNAAHKDAVISLDNDGPGDVQPPAPKADAAAGGDAQQPAAEGGEGAGPAGPPRARAPPRGRAPKPKAGSNGGATGQAVAGAGAGDGGKSGGETADTAHLLAVPARKRGRAATRARAPPESSSEDEETDSASSDSDSSGTDEELAVVKKAAAAQRLNARRGESEEPGAQEAGEEEGKRSRRVPSRFFE